MTRPTLKEALLGEIAALQNNGRNPAEVLSVIASPTCEELRTLVNYADRDAPNTILGVPLALSHDVDDYKIIRTV